MPRRAELGLPRRIVGGSISQRLSAIVAQLGLPMVMPIDAAISLAIDEVAAMHTADEIARHAAVSAA
jgi:hypothetical protein